MKKTTSPVLTTPIPRTVKAKREDSSRSGTLGCRLFLLIALSGVLVFACACDPGRVFEKNKTLEGGVWKSSDIAKFNVPIADTSLLYDFYLNIRINGEYRYANMFLFMKTLYPDGRSSRDTIECFLADVDGRWLGSRSGKNIDNRILLLRDLKYPLSGTYSFEFEQAMRDTLLENVEDFGIRIEKADH